MKLKTYSSQRQAQIFRGLNIAHIILFLVIFKTLR